MLELPIEFLQNQTKRMSFMDLELLDLL
jgi:hypothetical protein